MRILTGGQNHEIEVSEFVSLAVLFRWKVAEPILIACAALAGLALHLG
jgi:hypothetical protein